MAIGNHVLSLKPALTIDQTYANAFTGRLLLGIRFIKPKDSSPQVALGPKGCKVPDESLDCLVNTPVSRCLDGASIHFLEEQGELVTVIG